MDRRTLLGFLSIGALSLFCNAEIFAATLTDKNIHGSYVGLNPLLVSRGASYDESLIRFSLDKNGVVLETVLEVGYQPLKFLVHFTPEWITTPIKGWGVGDGIAVRQHLNSKLAKFIFFFTPRVQDGFDAIMILGEGMPATLGVFVREEKGHDRLRSFYQEEYQSKKIEGPVSWLKPLNIREATRIMRVGSPSQKIDVLQSAVYNLWTGTEQEISERLTLVAVGISDSNSKVQRQALETFILGGRVTGGVSLVVYALGRYRMLEPDVLETAIDAAASLLYETYYYNISAAAIRNSFGTTDVSRVYALTHGLVTPEQFEALEKIVRAPNSRRWTLEQQVALRNAIKAVVADDVRITKKAREIGTEALAAYPLPGAHTQNTKQMKERHAP